MSSLPIPVTVKAMTDASRSIAARGTPADPPSLTGAALPNGRAPSAGGDTTLARNKALLEAVAARSLGLPPHCRAELEPHPGAVDSNPSRLESTLNMRVRPITLVWELGKLGVNHESWRDPNNPAAAAFRRYARHCKTVWNKMKFDGHSVADQSIDYILDVATRPSSILIEVIAVPRSASGAQSTATNELHISRQPLGYALITTEARDIYDRHLLPDEYRGRDDIARGHEIFAVNLEGNLLFPEDYLAGTMIDKVLELTGGKTILTKVVEEPHKYAYTWSRRFLERHGFHRTGHTITENVIEPVVPGVRAEPEPVALASGWYAREPGARTAAQSRRETRVAESRRWVKERIASGINFPAAGKRLAFWSVGRGDNEALLFAGQQAQNAVIAFELEPSPKHLYRENLDFAPGRADGLVLPGGSIDGGFYLNVLPYIVAHGPSDQPWENVREFFKNQWRQLRWDSLMAVRDFMLPDWPETLEVRIPLADGCAAGPLSKISSSAFFCFCREHEHLGQDAQARPSPDPACGCWRISRADAFKLLFLNSWRRDGDITAQLDLPLGLGTQLDFLQLARRDLNCRVRSCREIRTPWVMKQLRAQGITFWDVQGRRMEEPANQCEIVMEKIKPHEGVFVEELSAERLLKPSYLSSRFFRREKDGEQRQLVSRQGRHVYFVYPVWEVDGERWVLAKEGYPRPIPQVMYDKTTEDKSRGRDFSLSRSISSGYAIEPIALVPEPGESPEDAIIRCLRTRACIPENDIPSAEVLAAIPRVISLSSASAIDEVSEHVVVPVSPSAYTVRPEFGYSGLYTSGTVRPFRLTDIIDVVDSSQISGIHLANMAYREILGGGKAIPPWNGAPLGLQDQPDAGITIVPAAELFGKKPVSFTRQWVEESAPLPEEEHFYEIWRSVFAEQDGHGDRISELNGKPLTVALEYAAPAEHTKLTNNTIAMLALTKVKGKILVGFERRDDLPLVEEALKQNTLPCSHAFRIRYDLPAHSRADAEDFAVAKLEEVARVKVLRRLSLGAELYVNAGLLPERCYPCCVEIDAGTAASSNLIFCELKDCLRHINLVACAHTSTTILRGAHAAGLLTSDSPSPLLR